MVCECVTDVAGENGAWVDEVRVNTHSAHEHDVNGVNRYVARVRIVRENGGGVNRTDAVIYVCVLVDVCDGEVDSPKSQGLRKSDRGGDLIM